MTDKATQWSDLGPTKNIPNWKYDLFAMERPHVQTFQGETMLGLNPF